MRILFIPFLFISLLSFGQNNPALMPVPQSVIYESGKLRVDEKFTIGLINQSEELSAYSTRFLRRLSARTGLFLGQDQVIRDNAGESGSLFIRVKASEVLNLEVSEAYSLDISSGGIVINADTDFAAMRSLETLLQLLSADESGYYFPNVSIEDNPRFPWRGLLIDVCRHWMPVDVIKRNLDAMAAMKMNVLHLHLTEDQGFRIESQVFPRLHEFGSNGDYFTQSEMKDIINYAAERGIRVVPEFDMPGHATSWFVGYPELASAPGPYQIETGYGVMDPTMDPARESTYEFLDQFLGEMANLFPDEYIHIGGDENNGKQWDSNSSIQNFMNENGIEDNHALQSYFNERILEILNKHGKKMMGWDEILQPGVSKDILIQSWRGKEALVDAAQQGYTSILSNGYYIDLVWSTERHYMNDPLSEAGNLNSEEVKNILGGEATMWAELITPETIDSRIWPRTAAIAERFWSAETVDDVEDMYARLEVISRQLEEHGLTHIKNYEMMLRRLANQQDVSALKVLVDVLEPLENYQRHSQGKKMTTYAPFSRVADAARPESMKARNFSVMVESYLKSKDSSLKEELKAQLLIWVENHQELVRIIKSSPVLGDAKTLSQDLGSIATIGYQALSDMVSHDDTWKQNSLKVLEAAKKPRVECELVVVDPIIRLVESAQ